MKRLGSGLITAAAMMAMAASELLPPVRPPRRGMTDVLDSARTIFNEESTTRKRLRPQRYLGQTAEQRAWNQAVDERKAAKKGHKT